ncbi:hypothetical protein SRB5_38500 [Streptomyces sp. RB5]|uniref:Uncharacterized protein n=1 Tax=Streptomyces smaragdinus TaxID=2585196 RepID=A0A7K0CJN5_9ACTN|nr:hypothetical protein [Streptomyces smaragdinus]MQY13700.1 hypothetical protein [Streptomyces smaragdinus]
MAAVKRLWGDGAVGRPGSTGVGVLFAGVCLVALGMFAAGTASGATGWGDMLGVLGPIVVGLVGLPSLAGALLHRGRGGTGVMIAAVLGLAAALPAAGERVPYPLVVAVGLGIVAYLAALQGYAAGTWRAVHWQAVLGAVAVLLAAAALSVVPVRVSEETRAVLLAMGFAAAAGAFAVAVGVRPPGSRPRRRPTGRSPRH